MPLPPSSSHTSENTHEPFGDHSIQDAADQDQRQSTTPLAGPGSTRQSRKLQLRRAGFKGKMVPNRNITPKHMPSDSWPRNRDASAPLDLDVHTMSEIMGDSDRVMSPTSKPGILQEISNSSFRRRKHTRPRVEDSGSVFQDENVKSPRTASGQGRLDKDPFPEW